MLLEKILILGIFEEVTESTKLKTCVFECCFKETCNVAFMHNDKCYHIACNSDELCLPTSSTNLNSSDRLFLVLVRPRDALRWEDVLHQEGINILY